MTFGRGLIILWLLWCVSLTGQYVPVWHSDFTLWTHAVTRAPHLPRAYINLGKALIAAGNRPRGIQVAMHGYDLEIARYDSRYAWAAGWRVRRDSR